MYNKIISVIVPVYNVKDYLEKCVKSVLNQKFYEFELILVDDGSTDGSSELCDRMAETDERISVIHKQNGGLSDARNAGTKISTGNWITYIDSDDYVNTDYLQDLYVNAINNNADISVVGLMDVYESDYDEKKVIDKGSDNRIYCLSGKEAVAKIVCDNDRAMIVACGKLYNNKFKEMLNYPKGMLNEDEFITYKLLYAADKVVISSCKYYYYLQRNNSIMSSNYSIKRLAKLDALKEAIEYFDARGEVKLLNAAKLRYFLNLQISWYRINKSNIIENKEELLFEIKNKHKIFWKKESYIIKRNSGFMDKIVIYIFLINPKLYCLFSDFYLIYCHH